jgi:hypothetical protein
MTLPLEGFKICVGEDDRQTSKALKPFNPVPLGHFSGTMLVKSMSFASRDSLGWAHASKGERKGSHSKRSME